VPAVIQVASSPNFERLLSARKHHGRALVDAMPMTGNDELLETKYETELIGGPPDEAIAAAFSLDSGGASPRRRGFTERNEGSGSAQRPDRLCRRHHHRPSPGGRRLRTSVSPHSAACRTPSAT